MMLTRVLFRFDSIQHYTQSLNDLLAAASGLLRRARNISKPRHRSLQKSYSRARIRRV
jgi:hypothetical protein